MENGGEMENPGEIYQLCRLCLANNQVNVPIFGEKSDIRQISLKISSCLPVKIAVDDSLPKNICEGCSDKLELFYAFWNSSQEADKTLRAWIEQININNASETISAVVKQITNSEVVPLTVELISNSEGIPLISEVKEETEDPAEDGHDEVIDQPFDDDEDVDEKDFEEAPPPKKARYSPTEENTSINQESDEDDDAEEEYDGDEVEPKVEDESDMSGSDEDEPLSSRLADMAGTSKDEAGPSGVGKDGEKFLEIESIIVKEEQLDREMPSAYISSRKRLLLAKTNTNTQKNKTKNRCVTCGEEFAGAGTLMKHKERAHQPKREFHCDLCSAFFDTSVGLKDHKRRHFLEQRYACELCGKSFVYNSHLIRHMTSHSEERNFECTLCKVNYKIKSHLNFHLKTHHVPQAGEKEKLLMERCHICEICGKGFIDVSHLNSHIIAHSKERKFQCDICGAKYKRKVHLNAHLKKHVSNQ